ncbi:MAG: hypothetical protein JWM12_1484 [Ilumatobacteraceae bacterium]|nr:hypothetical protein [Ilumatobacteraceae bacterium]
MAQAPGWFADPYGRFQQRYHDGQSWTAHVADDGVRRVDPMGASPVVPFAQPQHTLTGAPTATGATAATAHGGAEAISRFLDSFGPHARVREAPSLHTALAGAGGTIAATGILIAIAGGDGGRGLAAVAGILLIAAGLALRLWLPHQRELRSAAVGIGVVGIVSIGAAIVGDNVDGAGGFLLVGLLFVAAWALPGFRGAPIMLGLGALSLVFALGSAASGSGEQSVGSLGVGSVGNYQGSVFLVAAAALLGLVYALDRAGFRGVGTSLVVAALVAAVVGAASTVSKLDDTGGTLLIVLVGLVVCIVGSHGERRATTWYGAAMASIGVVAFLVAAIGPSSQSEIATVAVFAGVILVVVPLVISGVRASRAASGPGGSDTDPASSAPLAPPRQ